MEGMTGRWGRIICSTCVVIYTFGTTITFLIIIGDQFDSTFNSLYGPTFAQKVLDNQCILKLLWHFILNNLTYMINS